MIEPAGVLVFLFGAAHHDAVAQFPGTHQVHGGDAGGIEPVARKIERRAVADLEPQSVAVELLGALEIRRFDGKMLQCAQWHRRFSFRQR